MSVTESDEVHSIWNEIEESKGASLKDNNVLYDLPTEASHAFITVYLRYAYCSKAQTFSINTEIVNGNRISLNSIVDGISNFISLSSFSISYSQDEKEVYFFCGTLPLEQTVLCELTPKKSIWIKLRQNTNAHCCLRNDFLSEEEDSMNSLGFEEERKTNYFFNAKSKRAQERTIVEIINKVYLWKRLYQGVINSKENFVKLTLQEAAKNLKISHKSLDEYLNQLKLGKKFGFDFNKHKKDKFGVLRGYIKSISKKVDPLFIKQMKSKRQGAILQTNSRENSTEVEEVNDNGNCNAKCDEDWDKIEAFFNEYSSDEPSLIFNLSD